MNDQQNFLADALKSIVRDALREELLKLQPNDRKSFF